MGGAPLREVDTTVSDTSRFTRINLRTDIFRYEVTYDPPIDLNQGRFWIGYQFPLGTGSETSLWLESNGGVDGAGTNESYTSFLGGGLTWDCVNSENFAFELEFRDCI